MSINKSEILNKICYTELVYKRINNKLKTELSKPEIEKMIHAILSETPEKYFKIIGKNIYVNSDNKMKVTINSNTFRIITVEQLK